MRNQGSPRIWILIKFYCAVNFVETPLTGFDITMPHVFRHVAPDSGWPRRTKPWWNSKRSIKVMIFKKNINFVPLRLKHQRIVPRWSQWSLKSLVYVMTCLQAPYICISVDIWRSGQDARQLADGILKCISCMEMLNFLSKCHWTLFSRLQIARSQYWFRY